MNPCSSGIAAVSYATTWNADGSCSTGAPPRSHGTARNWSRRTAAGSALDDAQHLPPVEPSKIVCVHLNYESRRAEFGATLGAAPTYFHKPITSLNAPRRRRGPAASLPIPQLRGRDRDRDRRARRRHVAPDEAGGHILGYTVGERLRAARLPRHRRRLDAPGQGLRHALPARSRSGRRTGTSTAKRIQTRVNGEVRQDGNTDEMIWDMHYLVADIARTITLVPGDVLLSGTPANSRPVEPGDVVEVEVEGLGTLRNTIVEGERRRSARTWARSRAPPRRWMSTAFGGEWEFRGSARPAATPEPDRRARHPPFVLGCSHRSKEEDPMLRFTIDIDAPPAKVFDELAHVERHPAWANPKAEMGMEQVDGTEPGPGARYRSKGVFVGKQVSADISVTAFEPGRVFADPLGPAPGGQGGRLVREPVHPHAGRERHPPGEDRDERHEPGDALRRQAGDQARRDDLAPQPQGTGRSHRLNSPATSREEPAYPSPVSFGYEGVAAWTSRGSGSGSCGRTCTASSEASTFTETGANGAARTSASRPSR